MDVSVITESLKKKTKTQQSNKQHNNQQAKLKKQNRSTNQKNKAKAEKGGTIWIEFATSIEYKNKIKKYKIVSKTYLTKITHKDNQIQTITGNTNIKTTKTLIKSKITSNNTKPVTYITLNHKEHQKKT